MKKHLTAIFIGLGQIFLFYLFPLIARPLGPMGMVLFLIFASFALALVMGWAYRAKLRFLYPALVAALFIPSVYIYYNESALVQALWYLVVSSVGLAIGSLLRLNSGR